MADLNQKTTAMPAVGSVQRLQVDTGGRLGFKVFKELTFCRLGEHSSVLCWRTMALVNLLR